MKWFPLTICWVCWRPLLRRNSWTTWVWFPWLDRRREHGRCCPECVDGLCAMVMSRWPATIGPRKTGDLE